MGRLDEFNQEESAADDNRLPETLLGLCQEDVRGELLRLLSDLIKSDDELVTVFTQGLDLLNSLNNDLGNIELTDGKYVSQEILEKLQQFNLSYQELLGKVKNAKKKLEAE